MVLRPLINFKTYTSNRINLPAAFARAGCEVSFQPARDTIEEHARVFQRVAALVKAGMKREDALAALTLHPARLLGLGERLGSIEKGKDANLLFLTGEPFDALTRIQEVMLDGKIKAQGRPIQ
jgi:imidazolonepropionase-like amidohydrolase